MRRLITLLLALTLIATGCRRQTRTGVPTAPDGAEFPQTIGSVEIPQRPTKIVSLSSTATEILFEIGARDQVTAVDNQSNFPADAPKTDLSGFQPSVEAVAGRNPDLVVISYDPGQFEAALKALNIPVLLQPTAKKLDDSYQQIKDLGRATGHLTEAQKLADEMASDIRRITASAANNRATYYHELDNTFFTATSTTFIGQIYSLLGMRNIGDAADTSGTGSPQLSAEYIVKANPDFIFLADTKCCAQTYETVAARPGWNEITAVKERRVISLDDDIASRWGPRVVEFLETVANAVRTREPAGY